MLYKIQFVLLLVFLSACNNRYVILNQKPNGHYTQSEFAATSVDKGNRLIVPVAINDAPARLIIDTGCTYTVLSKTFADKIHIPKRFLYYTQANTPHGSILYPRGIAKQVVIGNLLYQNLDVGLLPDTALRQVEDELGLTYTDGMLGGAVLKQFRAVLDLGEGTLGFSASDEPANIGGETVVARLFPMQADLVAVEATVDGTNALFMIDTGMNSWGAYNGESKLNSILSRTTSPPGKAYAGKTVRPTEQAGLIAQRLEVAGIVSEKVIFNFRPGIGSGKLLPVYGSRSVDGTLGLPFFLKNGLIIDYGRMEVRRRIHSASPVIDRKELAGSLPESP